MTMVEPELPLIFSCAGSQLLGILHRGATDPERAVLVVVGGPQYRVGSHRQFVLLARRLAAAGVPVLRFDYRGMGDSDGAPRSFEAIQDDIAAAIDCLFGEYPSLKQVVLWGLCDAASAIAFYAAGDPRVTGLVLLNPWVQTSAGTAKAYLRHYYWRRLLSRQFWLKLQRGGVQLRDSLNSLGQFLRAATRRSPTNDAPARTDTADPRGMALPTRMLHGLRDFPGQVLLILSGNDLTAREFSALVADDPAWSRWAQRQTIQRQDHAHADHTFSCQAWRATVEDCTLAWLRSW